MPTESFEPINFRSAEFLCSAARLHQCPADEGLEVAFAGRSNAGKSSAINCLTEKKKLARTSKTPGRTQLINFFDLGRDFRLVDLPGYGYAKVPQSVKLDWQKNLNDYLNNRQCLRGLVLVMDCRHPLKEFDQMMIHWADQAELPAHILLTKADKLKRGPAHNAQQKVNHFLKQNSNHLSSQLFSANNKLGLEELNRKLQSWYADQE